MTGRRQGYLSCPTTFWRTQMLLGLRLALLLSQTGANDAKRLLGISSVCGTCLRVLPACFALRGREAGGARTDHIFNNDLLALHPLPYTMRCCLGYLEHLLFAPRYTPYWLDQHSADLVCLQDVEFFQHWWNPHLSNAGYDSIFKQRTSASGPHREGVIIAWKRDAFDLFRSGEMDLNRWTRTSHNAGRRAKSTI